MNSQKKYLEIKNDAAPAAMADIPVMEYSVFCSRLSDLLEHEANHCVAYYAVETEGRLKFYCSVADDENNTIAIFSHLQNSLQPSLKSLTPALPQLHNFEREIHENYGVEFEGHPWLKPLRYPHDRSDTLNVMDNYPFYKIDGEDLHEVGVGPIHAGVIEPGHFRFICNGEKVLHLEIQLGYQHRGVEKMLRNEKSPLRRCLISESIAGDTSIGHGLAHVQIMESLSGLEVHDSLRIERCIALELERLALHIGDTAALCGDVAYQLGQVVCEALRTTIINTTQFWCGNRFGKGLIRPGGSNYPLTEASSKEILQNVTEAGKRFAEMTGRIYSLPTALARFEDIGTVTNLQASRIGAVGMAARTCGIVRDIRKTHPFQYYGQMGIQPVIQKSGDVLARAVQRDLEARDSVRMIGKLIEIWRGIDHRIKKPVYNYKLKPDSYAVSLTEAWRGEICHAVITDKSGDVVHYKVKDPSFHNWLALALAVRNQEISDFPVCNKSFNLSYCGNDL